MNLVTLRKKARSGSLEVEDILRAAIEKQPGLSEELARLTAECGWLTNGLRPDGTRFVPLAKWAEVASAYASEAFIGLALYAKSPENIRFVLGLVEQIKSNESVAFVLEVCSQHLRTPAQSEELAFRVVTSFNILLSFKPAASITPTQAIAIQDYLLGLYPLASTEARRATVLLALRGVGDQSTIRFVESVPDFEEPWIETKKNVVRAVRKRLAENGL